MGCVWLDYISSLDYLNDYDDARIYAIFAVGFCVTVKAVAKPG